MKAGEYRIIDEAKPSILAAHLVLDNNLMPINFGQLSAADKASLISVSLLPIASLAGNAAADIIMVINIIIFFTVASGTVESYSQSWFLRLSFIFWGWTLFCSAVSAFPAHSFQDSLPWIRFPLYAFSLSHLLDKKTGHNLNAFIGATILGTLIQLSFLFYEYSFVRGDLARLHGTFGKLIAGWYLTCFSLVALLWCFEKFKSSLEDTRARIGIGLFTVAVTYGVVITGEIMSTLFFFGALFLYFAIRKSYSLKSLSAIAVGLLAIIGCGVLISLKDPALQERLVHSITTRLPWMPSSDYNLPWTTGVTMALENPLFGVGPKNFNLYCLSLKQSGTLEALLRVTECQWHPHNLYLQIADETGVFGLIIFLCLAGYLIRAAYQHSASNLWTNNIPLVLMIVIFFPLQTYSQAFGQSKNFYLWTLVGFALFTLRHQLKDRDSNERL